MDVIIPTKNCAEDLEECLESLKKQVLPVNIIVVDAYSTDGTREVVDRYGAVLVDEPHSEGVGSRRAVACNEGLKCASGHLVAFLDSDVVVPEDWSMAMCDYFFGNWIYDGKPIAGITSGCKVRSGLLARSINRLMGMFSMHSHNFDELTPLESIPGYNSVYLKSSIEQIGGFNECLGGCEDWELNYRLRKNGWTLLGVPAPPVIHKERNSLWSFARQMYGYGWSRARLLTRGGIYTAKYAVPTIMILLAMMVLVAYPKTVYVGLVGLVGCLIAAFFLENYLFGIVSLVFFLSWGIGYCKGLID